MLAVLTTLALAVLVVALLGWRVLGVFWSVDDYAAYWRERAAVPGDLTLVALGDSTAQGVGADRPERGYVGLLADRLAARTGRSVRVVNLSRTGAKVDEVLRVQVPHLAGLDADLVTVAVGANDAGRTPTPVFAERFARLLAALPEGSYVADVPQFADIPNFVNGPRIVPARDLAAAARRALAAHPALVAVPLERSVRFGWRDYGGDWFHPGDRGYRRWADVFWARIEPRLPG